MCRVPSSSSRARNRSSGSFVFWILRPIAVPPASITPHTYPPPLHLVVSVPRSRRREGPQLPRTPPLGSRVNRVKGPRLIREPRPFLYSCPAPPPGRRALDGRSGALRGRYLQDAGCELLRTHLPRRS